MLFAQAHFIPIPWRENCRNSIEEILEIDLAPKDSCCSTLLHKRLLNLVPTRSAVDVEAIGMCKRPSSWKSELVGMSRGHGRLCVGLKVHSRTSTHQYCHRADHIVERIMLECKIDDRLIHSMHHHRIELPTTVH